MYKKFIVANTPKAIKIKDQKYVIKEYVNNIN